MTIESNYSSSVTGGSGDTLQLSVPVKDLSPARLQQLFDVSFGCIAPDTSPSTLTLSLGNDFLLTSLTSDNGLEFQTQVDEGNRIRVFADISEEGVQKSLKVSEGYEQLIVASEAVQLPSGMFIQLALFPKQREIEGVKFTLWDIDTPWELTDLKGLMTGISMEQYLCYLSSAEARMNAWLSRQNRWVDIRRAEFVFLSGNIPFVNVTADFKSDTSKVRYEEKPVFYPNEDSFEMMSQEMTKQNPPQKRFLIVTASSSEGLDSRLKKLREEFPQLTTGLFCEVKELELWMVVAVVPCLVERWLLGNDMYRVQKELQHRANSLRGRNKAPRSITCLHAYDVVIDVMVVDSQRELECSKYVASFHIPPGNSDQTLRNYLGKKRLEAGVLKRLFVSRTGKCIPHQVSLPSELMLPADEDTSKSPPADDNQLWGVWYGVTISIEEDNTVDFAY